MVIPPFATLGLTRYVVCDVFGPELQLWLVVRFRLFKSRDEVGARAFMHVFAGLAGAMLIKGYVLWQSFCDHCSFAWSA